MSYASYPSFLKFCVGQLAVAGLLSIAIPSRPASAATDYQVCAGELVRADVSPELAARACSDALYPKDLSLCVLKIGTVTPTIATEALSACTRVRRPIEMANCVVRISNRTENAETLATIDHCRRSLLPERFAECVIGLNREVDLSPGSAMETCIAAIDFPRSLFPTVAPPPPPNPTLPPDVPDSIPGLSDFTTTPTAPLDLNIPMNPANP